MITWSSEIPERRIVSQTVVAKPEPESKSASPGMFLI